jgi:AcrR family transcriptional regulator
VPRPRLHDTETLLDAAAAIVATDGPAGLTMAGLAKATGAPSGSLYHRFGSRDALLGAVRVRAALAFEAGFVERLAGSPPVEACVSAARYVVAWSRTEAVLVQVLLRSEREFAPEGWPDEIRKARAGFSARTEAALDEAGRRVGDRERVLIATVDLPYAVVRRHLTIGGALPSDAEDVVAEAARALLR